MSQSRECVRPTASSEAGSAGNEWLSDALLSHVEVKPDRMSYFRHFYFHWLPLPLLLPCTLVFQRGALGRSYGERRVSVDFVCEPPPSE